MNPPTKGLVEVERKSDDGKEYVAFRNWARLNKYIANLTMVPP